MLSSYDVESQQFAVLTGFELPEVAQQVYGAKVAGTTANSAILEWSTTQPEAGISPVHQVIIHLMNGMNPFCHLLVLSLFYIPFS